MVGNATEVGGLVVGADPEFSIIIARYPEGIIARGGRTHVPPYTYPVVIQNIERSLKGVKRLGV